MFVVQMKDVLPLAVLRIRGGHGLGSSRDWLLLPSSPSLRDGLRHWVSEHASLDQYLSSLQ